MRCGVDSSGEVGGGVADVEIEDVRRSGGKGFMPALEFWRLRVHPFLCFASLFDSFEEISPYIQTCQFVTATIVRRESYSMYSRGKSP